MSQRGPDNPQPLDNVPILGWAVSQLAGLFGGGSPPPVLSGSDKRALEAAGYDVQRRGRAKGPVVVSPQGTVYRGRQDLKDLRALIRSGQLTRPPQGTSAADRYTTPVWAVAPIIAVTNTAKLRGAILKRWKGAKTKLLKTPRGRALYSWYYDTAAGLRVRVAKSQIAKITTRPAARVLARTLPKVLEGAAAGARGGGWGVAIGAGIVVGEEVIRAVLEKEKGIPEWEDIRVTAQRLPVPPSSPPRSQRLPAAPRPRPPAASTSASTRPTASPVLEEIRVTAKRIPVPSTAPTTVPATPGPLPPTPAPKPRWLQILEATSALYRSQTKAPVPTSRSILNFSQAPALQTQPLTYFQGGGLASPRRTKTCECKPKRKRSQPTCRNPVVRRTKRNVDGRDLITVTREVKCQPSSRRKRP